ncbi:CYTH domain-containing protein [Pelomonas sp. V22]|jgi:CYTH domain-containing protein|uniref:CYTH domain-containing protein n=1 Tax=Pelomonas sp. V22 TaxID=2822139 RepID=UPI0024A817B5|nr:CYTH domain-containing protein [Pelomonas sp. V22]MDI4635805.1 CYTH domain-containing protein [Pelomonas sp. V22]
MAIEIERKFLVQGEAWRQPDARRYRQGYLNRDPARTVRVRCVGEQAWLTIKGRSVGASRAEFEYEIPFADGEQLLALCEGPLIDKFRHLVRHAGLLWEVDEFLGDNAGLVVAEIELSDEAQAFGRPPWLGAEVTEDPRYFNSKLAVHPFKDW